MNNDQAMLIGAGLQRLQTRIVFGYKWKHTEMVVCKHGKRIGACSQCYKESKGRVDGLH